MIHATLLRLTAAAQRILDAGGTEIPAPLLDEIGAAARRLLALPGPRNQALRLCGARIAATLLSLAGANRRTPVLLRARLRQLVREAYAVERLETDTAVVIPLPPRAGARAIPLPFAAHGVA